MKRKLRVFKRGTSLFAIALFVVSAGFSYELKTLKKINQIESATISQQTEFFFSIDSICFDQRGHLYVADSGLNTIAVFDKDGKQVGAFGRKGPGPGEFMGRPRAGRLDITCGNDRLPYVTDHGQQRISVFKEDFSFVKSHPVPALRDYPAVNRTGDIFLLSQGEDGKSLHRYDPNLALKNAFLDLSDHAASRYFPNLASDGRLSQYIMRKAMAADDFLIVCSNVALKIFVFDDKDRLARSFDIDNAVFVKDFEARVKKLRSAKLPPAAGRPAFCPSIFTSIRKEISIWDTSMRRSAALSSTVIRKGGSSKSCIGSLKKSWVRSGPIPGAGFTPSRSKGRRSAFLNDRPKAQSAILIRARNWVPSGSSRARRA